MVERQPGDQLPRAVGSPLIRAISTHQVSVANPHQVEDSVQTDGRNRLLGPFTHDGLGVERDAESRDTQHRQVVRAVSDRDHLFQAYAFVLGEAAERVREEARRAR